MSVHKKFYAGLICLILIGAASFWLYHDGKNQTDSNNQPIAQESAEKTTVGRIGDGYFNFEVADSPFERQQGLSGRQPLPLSDALLFVFDEPGKHCIWMKDMQFNIDILWFDNQKRLVYEKRYISPDTFPQSFCPDDDTLYVVEMTAGAADNNQIKLGDKLEIAL